MIRHPSLSWLKKIAGYAFFAAFALFALLSALVYWRFDEGLARQQIETALQAQGRQIRIQGSVHPILWPQPGVQFNQVSISTPQPPSPCCRCCCRNGVVRIVGEHNGHARLRQQRHGRQQRPQQRRADGLRGAIPEG